MTAITLVFLAIVALFLLLLLGKEITGRKFCVICASIAAGWIGMLVLYRLGVFREPLLIALFMGQSITGIYYLLETKIPERLTVFRLPFLLTATFLAYLLLDGGGGAAGTAVFLGLLWLGFGLVYAWRGKGRIGKIFQRIIACCRDW